MAIREIVRYPDPRLAVRCRTIETDWNGLEELVRDMVDTMYAADGAGLAAIQVGEPVRIFIIAPEIAGRESTDAPVVFINPEIVSLSAETETVEEGCLSFPGIFVPVDRALRCRTRARDMEGSTFEVDGEGLFARAMQHETDHLDGKLLADHVGRLKRRMIQRRLEREAEADSTP